MSCQYVYPFLYFQFVPFRDFISRYGSQNHNVAQSALAKEVLAEIPDQLVSYMKMINMAPRQPRPLQTPPAYSP